MEEALYYFRANVLFRNYQIEGPADRTLIYLTFFIQQCLKELEKHPGKKEGRSASFFSIDLVGRVDLAWLIPLVGWLVG